MKKIFYFTNVVLAIFFGSCNNERQGVEAEMAANEYAEIKKAEWLLGSWRGFSPEGVFGEQWEMSNDSLMSGKGYFVAGKDTVSSESLSLLQEGKRLFYVPTIRQQNDGKPVRFELTSMDDHALVFDNPAHDFPQRISCQKVTDDSIVASISGKIEGKESSQVFPMSRVK